MFYIDVFYINSKHFDEYNVLRTVLITSLVPFYKVCVVYHCENTAANCRVLSSCALPLHARPWPKHLNQMEYFWKQEPL